MEIGIIGAGDMGRLYARKLAGSYPVNVCDLPNKRAAVEKELAGTGVNVLSDGIEVSRISDIVIYSVEAGRIRKAVRAYGPSTKKGAIVAGQTSVKTPEIEAFEAFLPDDVDIVSCHSLHGPTVDPAGHTLALIRHGSSENAYRTFREAMEKLGSNIVEIPDYHEHDRITADTQAATHMGFESMGSAWKSAGFYPWENASYAGGIDNVKALMMLRIFGGRRTSTPAWP